MNRLLISSLLVVSSTSFAAEKSVEDNIITKQRVALADNTKDKGFAPQPPRDIDDLNGKN